MKKPALEAGSLNLNNFREPGWRVFKPIEDRFETFIQVYISDFLNIS